MGGDCRRSIQELYMPPVTQVNRSCRGAVRKGDKMQ
jgi:hypothetical protein